MNYISTITTSWGPMTVQDQFRVNFKRMNFWKKHIKWRSTWTHWRESAVKCVWWQRAAADGELSRERAALWYLAPPAVILFEPEEKRAKSQLTFAENVTGHVEYVLYSVIYLFIYNNQRRSMATQQGYVRELWVELFMKHDDSWLNHLMWPDIMCTLTADHLLEQTILLV